MAEESKKKVQLVCHCESDFGGRASTCQGIYQGIPYILSQLYKYHLKGIFLVNTSCIDASTLPYLHAIKEEGHQLGSHGHLHQKWHKNREASWRYDCGLAWSLLRQNKLTHRSNFYCAPKFSHIVRGCRLSNPQGQTSLLKLAWGLQQHTREVVYFHPFDFVKPDASPSLYCWMLYSRWKIVRKKFEELLRKC